MARMTGVALTLGTLVLLAGCGGQRPPQLGERMVIERNSDERPEWLRRVPADRDGLQFVIGIKTGSRSLDNANTDARQNAIQKVVEQVGGTGLVDYSRARVEAGLSDQEAGNYIKDGYRFLAQSVAQGTREHEMYYEHAKEWRQDGWRYLYDFYILVTVPRVELPDMARQAFQQQAAEARAANNAKAEAFANSLRQQLTRDATAP
jgi:hypothetical protein